MNYKNILILGSSGQIGRSLCNFLKEKNYNVIEFDIDRDLNEDLRNEKILDSILDKIDFVFFLAFDIGGSKYLEKYEKTFEFINNNTKIILNTFNSLKKNNTPFIFASSQMSNMTYSSYGSLKLLGEYYTKSLNGVIVKFWNVYGVESDDEEKSHVITDFIKMSFNGKINMRTDGNESRQLLYADDCSEALEIIMNNYDIINRDKSLDITSFEWVKIIDVAKIISDLNNSIYHLGESFDLQQNKQNEPNDYILKFWSPKTSLKDGIIKVINELR
jgi:nucleoside-diphosphate-sugar epimerase